MTVQVESSGRARSVVGRRARSLALVGFVSRVFGLLARRVLDLGRTVVRRARLVVVLRLLGRATLDHMATLRPIAAPLPTRHSSSRRFFGRISETEKRAVDQGEWHTGTGFVTRIAGLN